MKLLKFLISIALFIHIAIARADCFLVIENNQILRNEGDCDSRHSPCSTFKIAISLMAYEDGLLIDELNPVLAFQSHYVDYIDNWKQDHNPQMWMQHSCVWFSQVLTQHMGTNKFNDYVAKFSYGNCDISGDIGKNNGLTNSWLSSSLEISPNEQAEFLNKLINNNLPASIKAQELTRKILYIEDLPNGWELYGKTGSGYLLNKDRTAKLDLQIGWFIGWIQKGERSIIFVNFIRDEDIQNTYASKRAKSAAKENLLQMISFLG